MFHSIINALNLKDEDIDSIDSISSFHNEDYLITLKVKDHICPQCGSITHSIKDGTMSRFRTHLIDTFFLFEITFIIIRRFIVAMAVNPNCIVKSFDIFKYHLIRHLIINHLFSIQPFSFYQ